MKEPHAAFESGDLVSVAMEQGTFGVVKILHADPEGVHVRVYVQRFNQRPALNEIEELSLAPYGPDHEYPFSTGHIPVSWATFSTWSPVLISGRNTVNQNELEGYGTWKDDEEAGYF